MGLGLKSRSDKKGIRIRAGVATRPPPEGPLLKSISGIPFLCGI